MPGHRSGQSWPESIRTRLASLDTTELATTDDLHHPTGPAREAMRLAAEFFGAGQTWFLTNGSTGGILTLLAALVGRGKKVILPRTCHLSVGHALALFDLEPVWLEFPVRDNQSPLCFLPEITTQMVSQAMGNHPDSAAVFLTSPDYYGRCSDIKAISQIVHQAGMLLLIDEAHGAHFAASQESLPPTALASGADACVQSAHKTLPALTQGGYLHVSKTFMQQQPQVVQKITASLKIFQTSSPSFAIAASLDYARAYLQHEGPRQIKTILQKIQDLATGLWPDYLVSPASVHPIRGVTRDPLRVVIKKRDASLGSALDLARQLSHAGIDIELADLTRMVLIPSLDQPDKDFLTLKNALLGFNPYLSMQGETEKQDYQGIESAWLDLLTNPPEQAYPPGTILLASHETRRVFLDEAENLIAASAISPYPPGIPLLLPGERLDRRRLDLLKTLRNNGITLSGVDNDSVQVVV